MGMSRSENMRRIRSKDTAPEMSIRRLLRGMGFTGYRIHRKELPGNPDIAFIGRKKAIFIHGCFWHGHVCKEGSRRPKTNQGYWLPKIERNRQRDADSLAKLADLGWLVLTIWECEIADSARIAEKLQAFMWYCSTGKACLPTS